MGASPEGRSHRVNSSYVGSRGLWVRGVLAGCYGGLEFGNNYGIGSAFYPFRNSEIYGRSSTKWEHLLKADLIE
jgi:hypothetical protein